MTLNTEITEIFELNECIEWIKNNGFLTVAIQISKDLLSHSTRIKSYLQSNTSQLHKFYLVVTNSCSVDYLAVLHLGPCKVNAIISIGTVCLSKITPSIQEIPVFYIFGPKLKDSEICFIVESIFTEISDGKKTLILYENKYANCLNHLEDQLLYSCGNLIAYSQIWTFPQSTQKFIAKLEEAKYQFGPFSLNDDIKNYDSVIHIGICKSLAIKINSPSKLIELDVINKKIIVSSPSKYLRQRVGLMEKVKETACNKIGLIFTNSLPDVDSCFKRIKEYSLEKKKQAYMITMVETPDDCKLGNFGDIHAFVVVNNCWCSSFIERVKLPVPIISLTEYEISCGMAKNYGAFWNGKSDSGDGQEVSTTSSSTLTSKTWFGLEVNPENEINLIKDGQRGIASGYSNEFM